MDYLKEHFFSIGAFVLIAVMLGLALMGGKSASFGALDRTTVGNPWTFSGAVTHSGAVTNSAAVTNNGTVTNNAGQLHSYPLATSTSGNAILSVAEVAGYDVVLLSPATVGNTTLTLFASSTAPTFLPTAGDRQRTCFINATTSSGVIYTFAGGTGTTLLVSSSSLQTLGSKTLLPQKMGCFEFVRAPATATTFDIVSSYDAFQ